jgi:hypothetical protein
VTAIEDALRGTGKTIDELLAQLPDGGRAPIWEGPGGMVPEGTPTEMMAAGGFGRVHRPTLFLAGEAGPEEFAFSGAHKRFESSPAAAALAPVTLKADIHIHAMDGASVQRVVASRDFSEELERQILRNTHNLGAVIRQAARA